MNWFIVLKFWHHQVVQYAAHQHLLKLKTDDKSTVRSVLPSLLQMINISASDRKQGNSMCLQRLNNVRGEDHLIEKIQPQVSHYTQDGVN